MPKRSVLDEIQIAALSAVITLIENTEYSREWLKREFAETEIKSVRITDDILDAVEFAMVNQLSQIAAQLTVQLQAGIKHADTVDPNETSTMKRVKNILASSDNPSALEMLESLNQPNPKDSQMVMPTPLTTEVRETFASSHDYSFMESESDRSPRSYNYADRALAFDQWLESTIAFAKARGFEEGKAAAVSDIATGES